MEKNIFDKVFKDLDLSYFIAMVSHYDEQTLLTKNGRLIQTIAIKDVHRLGNKITGLYDVRTELRKSIDQHVKNNQVAIWISTVRKEVDFSDDVVYEKQFARDLKEAWDKKNYLKKRLVNDLYITIVYQHSPLHLNDWQRFINSLDAGFICDLHTKRLEMAHEDLNRIVDLMLYDLRMFEAKKLKITFENGKYVSPFSAFLGRIMYFDKVDIDLKDMDLALDIAPTKYVIGHDTLEIHKNNTAKHVAIIGLKEYQEVSSSQLHYLLGLDCTMVINELFSIISKDDAQKPLKDLDYLSGLREDEALIQAVGIREITSENREDHFCTHQINISITEPDLETLEKNVAKVADAMAKIGLVCVKEDVDIEHAFWSRVPANFQLIKRNQTVLKKFIGAFSCLYALPGGNYENVWGKPLVNFATNKGSIYFFNFHPNDVGHTLILGAKNSGRTTLVNFLFTMSMKYKPEVLYLASHFKSNALIEVLDGQICNHLLLPNPLLFLDEEELFEFLSIACNLHRMSDEESDILLQVVQSVSGMPLEQKFLKNLATLEVLNNPGAKKIKETLELFTTRYKDLFSNNNTDFDLNYICYFDLTFFTEADFEKKNYPKEERYIHQYREDLKKHHALRAAVMFLFFKVFAKRHSPDRKKILVISDLDDLIAEKYLSAVYLTEVFEEMQRQNGMVLMSVDSGQMDPASDLWATIASNVATRFLLSGENLIQNIAELMNFTEEGEEVYKSLPPKGNYFLIEQKDFMVSADLNLVDFPKLLKILSLNANDYNDYTQIHNLRLNKEEFLNKLYAAFEIE